MGIVLSVTAFTKNAPLIKKIPTRFLSFSIAFALLTLVNLQAGTFQNWDIVLYAINAIMISASANGIADANSKKEGASKEKN